MNREYRQQSGIDLRGLTGDGNLSSVVDTAGPEQRREIFRKSGEIIYPLVYQHLTRRHEIDRGHFLCAVAMNRLEPECLDRLHDDAEAAVSDLIRNGRVPIHSIEGWVASRLRATSVDAYRRRRGARGALQRPRLTRWLIAALLDDAWLKRLALEILEWVGVAQTAGVETWPLSAWASLRAGFTGEQGCTERAVAADVETVLAAMRRKPDWYELYVERPLSRKESPVLPGQRTSADPPREPAALALVADPEVDDAHLESRAAVAVAMLTARLGSGEASRQSVVEVLRAAFCSGTGAEELDRPPGTGPTVDEQVAALLADPAVVDRVVAAMPDIVDAARR